MLQTPIRIHRLAFLLLLLALLPARAASAQQTPTGRDLYESACAACHGADGRGMPRSTVGFDVAIPDFTDCSFATPEADADWIAIAHSGGPVRAFDRKMPAFGEALTIEQLSAILRYIRTFCRHDAWPRGELNMPRALVTEKAFPENEAVLTTSIATKDRNAWGNEFLYEQRIGSRSQFEIVVPVNVQEQSTGGWAKGLGDIAVAAKHAVFHSLDKGAILSVAGEVIFPTGDDTADLGAGVTRFEPFVAFGQLLPRDSFVQVQSGIELSTDTARRPHEAFWRAAVGRSLFAPQFGRAWTPMVEILGAHEFEDEAGVDWDIVPQLQVSLSRRQHILLNAGVQIPMTERDTRSTRLLVYLLWDWFDGGLFEGWR
jgi:mono/diheme cytochrome c family protein